MVHILLVASSQISKQGHLGSIIGIASLGLGSSTELLHVKIRACIGKYMYVVGESQITDPGSSFD